MSTVKNVLAVIAGIVIGGFVNMGLITISGSVIPPPAGVDVTDMESLKASMHLFEPRHFIFPSWRMPAERLSVHFWPPLLPPVIR